MTNIKTLFIEADDLRRRLHVALIYSYQASGDSRRTRKLSSLVDKAEARSARRRTALIADDMRRAVKVSHKTMMRGYAERQI